MQGSAGYKRSARPTTPALPLFSGVLPVITGIVQKIKDLHGRFIEGRSSHWPAVRNAWLKDHPTCAACGRTDHLNVHHKRPFHLWPALELDRTNFLTLCENTPEQDHLIVGHFGNWKRFNPDVEADAAKLLAKRTRKAA